ncbi:uncharacterized protein LOC127286042 isoform X2 [Leptopilina boulardi]|nr:uncharacterized protein LOC127286042 isoform X2 [Leptopilina boulardi]
MLELVGKEELKTMTALGQTKSGKIRKSIPDGIRVAVYNYIESKTKGLSHKKYVETLNNQCCTLRNPKKSNTIAVERNDETERNKDKNVDKESANDELIFSGEPSATDNQSKAKKRKVMSPSEN